ncbi:uncharacterized protein LOC124131340 [Haliotis rufescens]|uniref:uncharacterized protein LOC124131340 n=1 Tax=Haliotis rufescens TaxID=6454 RepID=UPI00201F36EF|nr:uncharacterized protein LOC124131340 [Haliotis rufescens]
MGLPESSVCIIMNSWRKATRHQYRSYLDKWNIFCVKTNSDPLDPSPVVCIKFLTELYDSGVGYSAINTARSALSSILTLPSGLPIGQHPIIKRFLRGVYNTRPSLPKYHQTWDVGTVLVYLDRLGETSELSLKDLTLKLNMLLALVSGQRAQSLHLLKLKNMSESNNKVLFVLTDLVKQSRPGSHLKPIELERFENERLCVVSCLKSYLERTSAYRTDSVHDQLLLSHLRPHKPVTRETVSRWLKNTLAMAGIDITVFSGHSTRAAATSAASSQGTPIQTIMAAAGLSSENVFTKLYCKPVKHDGSFGSAVLSSMSSTSEISE